MKKFEWKIELLNQIPLIVLNSIGLFTPMISTILVYIIFIFRITSIWFIGVVLMLIQILLSLCFLRWLKPWLVGIPVQATVYGILFWIRYGVVNPQAFRLLMAGILTCQGLAIFIKWLIRRAKAKKATLESEVLEQ